MDIKAIKLVTGEEILAEIISDKDGWLEILNPVVPRMVSQNQIEFMAWFQLAGFADAKKREFTLEKGKFVINVLPAMPQMEKLYDEEFGVGLIVPDSNIKLA